MIGAFKQALSMRLNIYGSQKRRLNRSKILQGSGVVLGADAMMDRWIPQILPL
jgi:hypothetical protein